MGPSGSSLLVIALAALAPGCFLERSPTLEACSPERPCGADLSCVAGRCVPPPREDAGGVVDAGARSDAGSRRDGGLEPGPDAGAPDAGSPDAGSPDAGAPDAGAPDAGPPPCAEGSTRCVGERLETCRAGAFEGVTCAQGCVEGSPAACRSFTPSNVEPSLFLPLEAGTVTLSEERWDSSSCESLPYAPRVVGGLCVVRFAGDVRITGALRLQGDKPYVLLVSGRLEVAETGRIEASAVGPRGGPGGGNGAFVGSPASGPARGGNGASVGGFEDGGGGGGGSACADGGRGGNGDGAAGGSAGSGTRSVALVPLVGGSGGGAGSRFGAGAGGGGAVQLSVLGSLVVRGPIFAAGAGGEAGDANLPLDAGGYGGGGGGGGGGAILLESATSLTVEADLLAGGGGGGGAPGCWRGGFGSVTRGTTTPGGAGLAFPNQGLRPASCSTGHTQYGSNGGNGGDGTIRVNGEGGAGTGQEDGNGGGGGGAAGCVVLRSPDVARRGTVFGILQTIW